MTTFDWESEFDRWLEPFLVELGSKVRRRWAPVYVRGLLMPGERKSVTPMAERVAPGDGPQLHNFVADSPWDPAPLERILVEKVNGLLGGPKAHLIIDDTALPKKGEQSVGVSHQYCGALGKQANCQVLVSATIARDDIAAPLALRLFLPETWAKDEARRKRAKVPNDVRYQPKWEIALDVIDRLRSEGAEFGDVLADAGYGACAEFRRGLSERGLGWTVGILSSQNVYSADVSTSFPRSVGRPRKHPVTSEDPVSARAFIERHGRFRKVTWRNGTRGPMSGLFAVARVRPADVPRASRGTHPPGEPAWLICERLSNGTHKYYLSSLPDRATLRSVVSAVKARWACELAHQQMKEELGLDHFEGRSWRALHHHTLLVMVAFAFLTHLRIRRNIPSAQRLVARPNASRHPASAG